MRMIKRIEQECLDLAAEKVKFLNIVSIYTDGDIQADKKLNEIWDNLILWAWGDKSCKYDLKKGFGFIGAVGTSKSLTLRAFADYLERGNFWLLHLDEKLAIKAKLPPGKLFKFKNKINIIPETYLRELYLNDTNVYSDKVGFEFHINRPIAVAVDEVGAGANYFNHYGNKINLFSEFFNRRTDLNYLTHFTSNLTLDQLHQKFDDPMEQGGEIVPRFKSRLAAAINLIDFTADYDLRGQIKQF